jgi:hypothetical protein
MPHRSANRITAIYARQGLQDDMARSIFMLGLHVSIELQRMFGLQPLVS